MENCSRVVRFLLVALLAAASGRAGRSPGLRAEEQLRSQRVHVAYHEGGRRFGRAARPRRCQRWQRSHVHRREGRPRADPEGWTGPARSVSRHLKSGQLQLGTRTAEHCPAPRLQDERRLLHRLHRCRRELADRALDGEQGQPGRRRSLQRRDDPFARTNPFRTTTAACSCSGRTVISTSVSATGAPEGDPHGNGQNLDTLLGKILRIDVDHTDGDLPYAIPKDNPFVGQEGARGEIWAYGLRNPWRFSFDRETGDLYIADVGQGQYEEADFAPAGKGGLNFGWVIMEGPHCYQQENCDQTGLTMPFFSYTHDFGCSITGGYLYRGKAIKELIGRLSGGRLLLGQCLGHQSRNRCRDRTDAERRLGQLLRRRRRGRALPDRPQRRHPSNSRPGLIPANGTPSPGRQDMSRYVRIARSVGKSRRGSPDITTARGPRPAVGLRLAVGELTGFGGGSPGCGCGRPRP